MKNYIIANTPQSCRMILPGAEVISAKSYLSDSTFSMQRNARVVNLCRSYRYQSVGYYVSLLAQARGHKPLPSVQTIQDLKSPTMTRLAGAEFDDLIQQSLGHIQSDKFVLSIFFGHNMAKCHDRLAVRLFQYFQAPFLQAHFVMAHGKWQLQNIAPLPLNEVSEEHIEFAEQMAIDYLRRGVNQKKKSSAKYDLAILYNSKDPSPPSDERAIGRFVKAAEYVGFDAEVIGKDDYSSIAEFDALFLRETTAVNHHTYRFARRAQAEGLCVIDDPESILKCSNKVYLAELLDRYKIRTPKTLIVHADNIDTIGTQLGFPCVIKQPDGAFSNGVIKAETEKDLFSMMPDLLDKSDLLIAQEFVRTSFDWRICVFQQQPIFACKYYMARKHWQIYERLENGRTLSGKSETLPVSAAPKKVVRTALRAANLIGDGLYGVDIKEKDGECYVIEINDNQSIDSGVEDLVLQEDLYIRIMSGLLSRVERGKNAV